MKKQILSIFILIPFLGWAGEVKSGIDTAFYPGEGTEETEIQAWVGYEQSWPLLRGDSFLTENNNLSVKTTLSLSPVSLGSDLVINLTPLAFLILQQGIHLGTGWSLSDDIVGLGPNRDGFQDRSVNSPGGYVLKTWLGAALQFDLAEILPDKNEYAHVVFRSSFQYCYQYYNGADKEEPWRYQADDGMNFNGFVENTRTVLGYIVPHSALDFVGLMMETENYLGHVRSLSTIDSGGWGSDFTEVHIGPLMNWRIAEKHSLALLLQWANRLNYTEASEDEEFFLNRSCTGDKSFSFERIILSYQYSW